MFRIDHSGFPIPIMKHEHAEPYLLRRQELPDMYYYNCVIDVTRATTILEGRSMVGKRILPYVQDEAEVIDIDSPRDLEVARHLFGRTS